MFTIHERTAQQCRDKIKKLKVDYWKIKDKRKKTGEGRYPEWDYFNALDDILGHKPATEAPVVVNSLGSSTKDSPRCTETVATLHLNSLTVTSLVLHARQKAPGQLPLSYKSRGRGSAPKTERMENITAELIDKLVEAQQSSDRLTIELEEKRLKFERRQMDKEAQQWHEEREFQLRMMQMVMGQSVYGMPPPSMHVGPPSSASFAFGTMHDSTLARRMHTFPCSVCVSVCVFSLFSHLAQSGVQTAVSATSARYGHEI